MFVLLRSQERDEVGDKSLVGFAVSLSSCDLGRGLCLQVASKAFDICDVNESKYYQDRDSIILIV